MVIDSKIFKSYDIRGVYPGDINVDAAYKIARAFIRFLEAETKKKAADMHVVIGHDMRTSSPQLFGAAIEGLQSLGVAVANAGLIAIDQMYFMLGAHGYDGGIMITASHNPKEYNGMKMYKAGVHMISAEGIQKIRTLTDDDNGIAVGTLGRVEAVDYDDEYAKRIVSLVDISKIKPLRVVLDAGNGMAGRIFPLVLSRVPQISEEKMYFDPDGTFPNHEANPEKLENTRDIQQAVLNSKADFGAAFDGDADRIALIDDTGEVLRGDIITGILATYFLKLHPGSPIVYNVLCTRAVKDAIEAHGGVPIEWKTGHTNMKAKTRESGAVFGGEMSGHLFFKDFYYAESATLAFLIACQVVSESEKKLSEIAAEFKTYATFARYVYLDYEPSEAIERVRAAYASKAVKIDTIDGFTFLFEDPWWWFNVRSSNTEPRIHLTVESKDPAFTKAKKEEILGFTGGRVAGE